jgi:hypothetical protein
MGTLWKIPKINVKHMGNIIYHVNNNKNYLINYRDHGCILHASTSYSNMELIQHNSLIFL